MSDNVNNELDEFYRFIEQRYHDICRYLHDDVCALITLTKQSIYIYENDAIDKTEFLDRLKSNLTAINSKIRKTMGDLYPEDLDILPFPTVINALVDHYHVSSEKTAFIFTLNAENYPDNKVIKSGIYRIIQEALTNAIKYADAVIVQVILDNPTPDSFLVVIQDNGRGFNYGSAKKGRGLSNIEYRARAIGAVSEINSKEGEGTKITIELPLNMRLEEGSTRK